MGGLLEQLVGLDHDWDWTRLDDLDLDCAIVDCGTGLDDGTLDDAIVDCGIGLLDWDCWVVLLHGIIGLLHYRAEIVVR